MSTILTDDERRQAIQSIVLTSPGTADQIARAVEAAVLAKLAQQAPVAWLVEGMHEGRLIAHQVHLTSADALQLAAVFARHYPTVHTKPLYTHPAPPQADRQRVPDGWKLVPVEPPEEMARAGAQYAECGLPANAVFGYRAMLAAAPEAPAQAKPCLVKGDCKHGAWCSENYCQEHCQFVKSAQASAVDEREAFEAWVTNQGVALHYEGDGHYGNATVSRWWEAWQARAALAQKGGK